MVNPPKYKSKLKSNFESFFSVKNYYEENDGEFRLPVYAKILDNTWLTDNVLTELRQYDGGPRIDIRNLTDQYGTITGTTPTTNEEVFRYVGEYGTGGTKVFAVSTGKYLGFSEIIKLADNSKIELMTSSDRENFISGRPYYLIYDYYPQIRDPHEKPKDVVFDRQLTIKPISKKTFDRGSLVIEEHYAEYSVDSAGTKTYTKPLVLEENNYVYDDLTGNPVRRDTNIYYMMSDGNWSEPTPWPKYYTNSTEAESAGIRKRSTIIAELQDFMKQLEIISPLLSGHTAYFTSFLDTNFEDVQKFIQKNDSTLSTLIIADKDDLVNGMLWGTEITTPLTSTATPIWQLAVYYLT